MQRAGISRRSLFLDDDREDLDVHQRLVALVTLDLLDALDDVSALRDRARRGWAMHHRLNTIGFTTRGNAALWRPHPGRRTCTTRPKTVCLLSSHVVGAHVMKNCEPLVLGPALAIDTVYGRSWRRLRWNSSSNS
eukprot:scaffold117647_cov32-Tisochrysis_lutea.AAC.2